MKRRERESGRESEWKRKREIEPWPFGACLYMFFFFFFLLPLDLPYVTWAIQEGCLFYLRSSLWSSYLSLFYFSGLFPFLSFSHDHSGLLFLFWLPNRHTRKTSVVFLHWEGTGRATCQRGSESWLFLSTGKVKIPVTGMGSWCYGVNSEAWNLGDLGSLFLIREGQKLPWKVSHSYLEAASTTE